MTKLQRRKIAKAKKRERINKKKINVARIQNRADAKKRRLLGAA